MVVHTCNPSIQEPETGSSGIQSHPWLYREIEATLGYLRQASHERGERGGGGRERGEREKEEREEDWVCKTEVTVHKDCTPIS